MELRRSVHPKEHPNVPLYEYQCKQCGHRFEKIQSFSAPEEKECPVCKGEVERLISAPAIQFKGAGWYVNDYARSGGTKAKSEASGGDSSSKAETSSSSDGSGTSGKGGETSGTSSAPAAPAASKPTGNSSSGSSKE
jgi:putative FmdB family regulatory protein